MKLERSRLRRPGPGFGTYALTKVVGTGTARRVMLVLGDTTGYGKTLTEIEDYLEGVT